MLPAVYHYLFGLCVFFYQSSQEVEVFEVGFFGDSDFLCIICAILPGLPSLSF